MRFVKYKHIVPQYNSKTNSIDMQASTLIVKQTSPDGIGKVKYKFGYGKMNNQDISVISENIIAEYDGIKSVEELFEKYPEVLI